MDISKQYIKMCRGAKKIQESWKPREGDRFLFIYVANGREYTEVRLCCGYGNIGEDTEFEAALHCWEGDRIKFPEKKDCIWLPRQDQLQEMAIKKIGGNHIAALSKLIQTMLNQAGLGHYVSSPYFNHTNSMEQLWLAFVMHEKYQKKWKNGRWIAYAT